MVYTWISEVFVIKDPSSERRQWMIFLWLFLLSRPKKNLEGASIMAASIIRE